LSLFLENDLFVAHNVMFDYSFIKRQLKEQGYVYSPKLCCTVKLSRALYRETRGHSLEKIIQRHDIRVSARHRAYDDALALHEFVKIAIDQHGLDAVRENINRQTGTRSFQLRLDYDKDRIEKAII